MQVPRTRYAKSGDIHVAYQVFGDGEIDLVMAPGFVSHIENYWTEPRFARWLERLGRGCRVVLFDKRGTGLSDHVHDLPSMDERMDDVRAVMDAAGVDGAVQFGISEGGSLAALFAATHPDRCRSLVLYGAFARFSDWIPDHEHLAGFLDYIDNHWGSGDSLPYFAADHADDARLKDWWGRFERLGASPNAAMTLMKMNSQIDISHILPAVRLPSLVIHRTGDALIDIRGGRELARLIPGARLIELDGRDHMAFLGEDSDLIVDEIHRFVLGSEPAEAFERVLATVLFTDIVGSTGMAEAMGDRRWSERLAMHDDAVRSALHRFRGQEVKSLGDGFLVTFDGPGRAVKCALEISDTLRGQGIDIRAGLHTGEVEMTENDVRGIAVHTASRVASRAAANEVLVSRTVRDLVAGSGLAFRSAGIQAFAGLQDPMEVFAASPPS